MNNEVWQAKVEILASFASGPGIMIDDERERDKRVVSLLTLVDIEYETTERAIVTDLGARRRGIPQGERSTSNNFVDWQALVDELKKRPGTSKKLKYSKMQTATATASRQRLAFPELTIETERDGEEGFVILTYDAPKH